MGTGSLAIPFAGVVSAPGEALPALRDDLELLPAARAAGGAPFRQVYDPVRHAFFRIGWREYEILSRWHLGDAALVAAAVSRETTLAVTAGQVLAMRRFLAANSLLQPQPGNGPPATIGHGLPGRLAGLFSHRLPLFHPDRFLAATLPAVGFFFRRGFWLATGLAAVLGLYLVARQWQSFSHSFTYLFNLPGLFLFALTIAGVKLAHELAHGYTVKHYGLRVPVMGIAFIFLWPLLYTDTTDAWRLPAKRKRLMVGAAGVLAELAIASWATLLWSFLEPGPLRSAVFLVATTTWLQSLAVNLSPFMRFDGYYLLADFWEIANLRPRAFAVARWFLRRLLLGVDLPCPEVLPRRQLLLLLAYAVAAWLYLVMVFTSIAMLLYLKTFKLMGLVLLTFELGWFIGRPVLQEILSWWRLRARVRLVPLLRTLVIGGGLAVFLLAPWQGAIFAPAQLKAGKTARVYAPASGQLMEAAVTPGQAVEKGDLLFRILSPELDHQERQAARELARLELERKRAESSASKAEQMPVLEEQLVAAATALTGCRQQQAQLRMRAPFAGIAAEVAEALTPGRWLRDGEPLALIIETGRPIIEGYVRERDLDRLATGAPARFYPEHTELPVITGRLAKIDPTHEKSLSLPILASFYGGGLPARPDQDGRPVSQEAVYRFTMTTDGAAGLPLRMLRGTVRLAARPQSLFERFRLAVLRVAIRESDF